MTALRYVRFDLSNPNASTFLFRLVSLKNCSTKIPISKRKKKKCNQIAEIVVERTIVSDDGRHTRVVKHSLCPYHLKQYLEQTLLFFGNRDIPVKFTGNKKIETLSEMIVLIDTFFMNDFLKSMNRKARVVYRFADDFEDDFSANNVNTVFPDVRR